MNTHTRNTVVTMSAALCMGFLAFACSEPLSRVDQGEFSECTDCHGDPLTGDPSPPPAYWLDVDATDAHRIHRSPRGTFLPVACDTCHVVPERVADPGHMDSDLPAEVEFGGQAVAHGATPVYDADQKTCSNTYCHGGALEFSADLPAPQWDAPRDESCGTCHGTPPPAPHPDNSDCGSCHPSAGEGVRIADATMHLNGIIDIDPLACDGCHGSDGISAPPRDLLGGKETTLPGVGAHRSHYGESDWHAEVACDTCHVVPDLILDEGHMDGDGIAEVDLTGAAEADGADAVYDREALTCAGTYCHGSTLDTNAALEPPVWTDVSETGLDCNACHGSPPPAPHPARDQCADCHSDVVNAEGVFVRANAHIDGIVQVDEVIACGACHGTGDDGAPPLDLAGNSSTDEPGVGAHQDHLGASSWHAEITCEQCHVVPEARDDAGHIDSSDGAEVAFGGLATSDDADPSYDSEALTCAGTYCHGSTLTGTSEAPAVPVWTDIGDASCDSCHGAPPQRAHSPFRDDCGDCHSEVMDGDAFIDVTLHIDGIVQLDDDLACDSCHGSGDLGAPPTDLSGSSSTSQRGVGAHAAHLEASAQFGAVACDQCHVVPTDTFDAGHIDTFGPAELTFGSLASEDGASPSFNSTTLTCSETYCHGSTLSGATNTTPVWTGAGQAGCGSCHGLPPETDHPDNNQCQTCHGSVVDGPFNIITPSLHANGDVDMN